MRETGKDRNGELRGKKTERALRDRRGGETRERKINVYERVFVIKLWNTLNCSPGIVEVRLSRTCLHKKVSYTTVLCLDIVVLRWELQFYKNVLKIWFKLYYVGGWGWLNILCPGATAITMVFEGPVRNEVVGNIVEWVHVAHVCFGFFCLYFGKT